jgi:hypothetical protein
MTFTPQQEADLLALLAIENKTITDLESSPTLTGDMLTPVENGAGTFAASIQKFKDFIASKATKTAQGISYLNSQITIANNATDANNDIDYSAGNFQFSDGSGQAVATALTKRLDASWVAGTNQGGLDTGSKANSTWYHCYTIYNPTTLISDFLFSTGATVPTSLPSGYTKYRRVGSIRTDSSGNILPFSQLGNKFFMRTMEVANATPPNTSRFSLVTTIPTGIILEWFGSIYQSYSGGGGAVQSIFSSLASADITPTTTNLDNEASDGSTYTNVWNDSIITNTSAQIGLRFNATSPRYSVTTRGWIDYNI